MKDLYKILSISPESTLDEIRVAYRKLAKKHHPDKGGDTDYFCRLQEAYDILSNSESRNDYDRKRNSIPFGGQPFRIVVPDLHYQTADIFDDLFDVITRRFGINSRNIGDIEIIMSPYEAREETNLELHIPIERICDSCFGFGGTVLTECSICGGKGIVYGREILHLKINQGVNNGDIFILENPNIKVRATIRIEK